MPVQPKNPIPQKAVAGGPCPACGYRSCMCNDPRAGHTVDPLARRPQTRPAQRPPTQEEIDQQKQEYIEHLLDRIDNDWSKSTIRDLLRELVGNVEELRARLREKEEQENPPNVHVYRGPPRS